MKLAKIIGDCKGSKKLVIEVFLFLLSRAYDVMISSYFDCHNIYSYLDMNHGLLIATVWVRSLSGG